MQALYIVDQSWFARSRKNGQSKANTHAYNVWGQSMSVAKQKSQNLDILGTLEMAWKKST